MAAAEVRRLEIAQHEAAHIVVGLALGLTLERAYLGSTGEEAGGATFSIKGVSREADAIVSAAGVAWDRSVGAPKWRGQYDVQDARAQCSSRHGYLTLLTAAAAILAGRMREHALVTRALLEGDLGPDEIAALCRGEGDTHVRNRRRT